VQVQTRRAASGRRHRARVYEQVLVEGVEQDVREIIDVDELVALWDELYLPDHVRRVRCI